MKSNYVLNGVVWPGDADLVVRIRALEKCLDEVISVATGEVKHVYAGLCPDEVAGFDSIDTQCPACLKLRKAKKF